jgi:C_GCAxxG_C_C family probable redox protein
MEEQQIKEKVYRYYSEGYHCAEAIIKAIEELHPSEKQLPCRVASGFCGGIGKCHQDVCGALTGGLMALGNLYGRDQGGNDISEVVFLSSELRRLFLERFGSTVCYHILENIKGMPQMQNCKDVTAEATILLHKLLEETQQ